MERELEVNGKQYRIIRLLGHGKGGYSYFAERDGRQVVVKQIHHEPCDYYSFGNKIEAERRDYERLRSVGIRIPKMLDIDMGSERIVKDMWKDQACLSWCATVLRRRHICRRCGKWRRRLGRPV